MLKWWNAAWDSTNKKCIHNVLLREPVEQRLAVHLSCWTLTDIRGRLFIASFVTWLFIEIHVGEYKLSSLLFLILNQGSTSEMLLLVWTKTCFSFCRWDLISFDLWRVISAQSVFLKLISTHNSVNPAKVHNLILYKYNSCNSSCHPGDLTTGKKANFYILS